MKRIVLLFSACLGLGQSHDIITTPITFSREIARIFQARCWSCHRPGGTAFSLMTYSEARPWAEAIKEEVLARTMPPWGAVKGFGDFRNDQALTPEQIEVIQSWADGGVPEGVPADLPKGDPAPGPGSLGRPGGGVEVSGDFQLPHPFRLDGLLPESLPEKISARITAELPDGSVEPLVWLENYQSRYAHPFYFRSQLELPAGTVIRGVPPGAKLSLLPAAEPVVRLRSGK